MQHFYDFINSHFNSQLQSSGLINGYSENVVCYTNLSSGLKYIKLFYVRLRFLVVKTIEMIKGIF